MSKSNSFIILLFILGIDGRDGQTGKDGVNGMNGRDGKDAVRNWKECAWNNIDDRTQSGVIKVC